MVKTRNRPEPDAIELGHDDPPAGIDIGLGPRLRSLRRSRRLTLKALAAQANCSESLLSRVENGHVMPSLTTLHHLCRALGVNVGALLDAPREATCVVRGPAERPDHVRPEAQEGDGSAAQSLIPFAPGRQLEGLIVALPADGRWCGPFSHEGEEVGFVLEGTLELIVAGESYRVPAGSSFFFLSHHEHHYRAADRVPCRALWINTPPNF